MSKIVKVRVSLKKMKKCSACGSIFDGESCGCGCKEYKEVYVMVGG